MIEPEIAGRKRGQTLAEFAITLPILLILLFGIIEFGRIFQAWVTLQNSARAAARYATTGQYDEDRYALELEFVPVAGATGDLNSIVPCIRNEVAGDRNNDGIIEPPTATQAEIDTALANNLRQRGTRVDYYPNDPGDPNDLIEVYVGGPESLYATWYGGDDCDPTDPEDQNRRKDMARILSIYWEARRGAAGLALGSQILPDPIIGTRQGIGLSPSTWYDGSGADPQRSYPNPDEMPWYQVWNRPLPGDSDGNPATPAVYEQLVYSNEPGWFNMMICSSRPRLDESNSVVDSRNGRFATQITGGGLAPAGFSPACVLNEYPGTARAADGWTANTRDAGDNNGTTWLDAGGPGDTITIVITFNHPLVTPLGLASYLPLQARRTAVNEAFRAPRSNPLPFLSPDSSSALRTNTPTNTRTNTATHTATNTATNTTTPTASASPRPTNTDTPEFTCTALTLSQTISYQGDQVRFTLTNTLPYPVTLKRMVLNWTPPAGYAGLMHAGVVYIGASGSAIWLGTDTTSPTDIGDPVTVGVGTPTPAATAEFPFAAAANLNLAPARTRSACGS